MGMPQLKKYSYHIKTIDSHTEGEATRIIYEGFPKLPGSTMMEKRTTSLSTMTSCARR